MIIEIIIIIIIIIIMIIITMIIIIMTIIIITVLHLNSAAGSTSVFKLQGSRFDTRVRQLSIWVVLQG